MTQKTTINYRFENKEQLDIAKALKLTANSEFTSEQLDSNGQALPYFNDTVTLYKDSFEKMMNITNEVIEIKKKYNLTNYLYIKNNSSYYQEYFDKIAELFNFEQIIIPKNLSKIEKKNFWADNCFKELQKIQKLAEKELSKIILKYNLIENIKINCQCHYKTQAKIIQYNFNKEMLNSIIYSDPNKNFEMKLIPNVCSGTELIY